METVSIKPGRDAIRRLVAGLCVLNAAMLVFPQLCLPLVLLVPLMACPLAGKKQEPLVYAASLIPVVSSLMAGYDPLYACSLVLMTLLPFAAAKYLPASRHVGMEGVLWYMGAVAAALLGIIASATYAMGGPLWQTVTARWIDILGRHEQAGQLLYHFAAAGLVPLPEGFENSQLLVQEFDPAVMRQMLLSLRRVLESLLFDLLPMVFIQSSMIIGLFAALRVQRINGVVLVVEAKTPSEKKAHVAIPAGFRLIGLPLKARLPLTLMALAALILWMFSGEIPQTLGQMCYSTFETAFMLVGAAVFVAVFTGKHPKKKTLFGVLAAALYVIAPFVLFLIGLTDQTFHYRMKHSKPVD